MTHYMLWIQAFRTLRLKRESVNLCRTQTKFYTYTIRLCIFIIQTLLLTHLNSIICIKHSKFLKIFNFRVYLKPTELHTHYYLILNLESTKLLTQTTY